MHGSDIQAQTVEAVASSLALISDKTNTTELSSSDKSGILTRTIIDSGDINEQAVATTINAKEIMLNGKSLLDEKLDRDKLFQTITSEYNLNSEQLIQVKAILNSKDWYDKTTTMSQMGQIIITAIATVATAGTGSAAVGAIGGISNATVNTAVIASVNALAANAMTQIASGVITGDMNLDFNAMIKSAALAGAFSVVTTTIDTQMGYNKIDPTTGKQIVLSYGDKVSQQVLHGLAQKAIWRRYRNYHGK
jgi:filamentous hemagglutinin